MAASSLFRCGRWRGNPNGSSSAKPAKSFENREPASCLTVRVGSPDVAPVPSACLYGIGLSLQKTLVTGVFWGRGFLRLPIPGRGRGSSRRSDGRVRSLADRHG